MRKPTDKRPGAIAREIVERYCRRKSLAYCAGCQLPQDGIDRQLARRIAAEIRKARRGG